MIPDYDLEIMAYIYDQLRMLIITQTDISAFLKDIRVEETINLLRIIMNLSGYLYANSEVSKLYKGQTGLSSIIN
jgi:hypothetical protein